MTSETRADARAGARAAPAPPSRSRSSPLTTVTEEAATSGERVRRSGKSWKGSTRAGAIQATGDLYARAIAKCVLDGECKSCV